MKRIINRSIRPLMAIAVAALLAGCGDWLDVTPYDKDLETQIYSNEAQIQAAHNGLYLLLATEKLYGMQMTAGTVDLLGQQYGWYGNSKGEGNIKYMLMNYQYDEKDLKTRFNGIWGDMYNAVLNVNKFINSMSATEGMIEEWRENLLLGEAYAMRAFLHFDLLRLFGPVYKSDPDALAIPYYTSPKIEKKEYLPASAVIGKVLADIEIALSLLADDPILHYGIQDSGSDYYYSYRNNRLNYYAVSLLKARVLHYMGDNTKTEEYVRSILSGVDNNFDWVTKEEVEHQKHPDRIFYPEVVFGVHDDNMYKNWTMYFSGEITVYEHVYLKTANDLRYAFGAVNLDNLLDYRAKQWNKFIDPSGNYHFSTKFKRPSYDDWNGEFFRPLMRKSELYYILAECSGDVSWLQKVKEKRVNNSAIVSLDDELTKEYMLEFFGEGQMFYFYKRRGAARIRNGSTVAGESYRNMTTEMYMPPIPKSEKER